MARIVTTGPWLVCALALVCACASPKRVPPTQAPAGLQPAYASSRDDLFPEGASFDEVSGAFFLGSLSHGDVTRIGSDGRESVFHAPAGPAGRSTLGMAVDAAARRLWVCVLADAKSKAGRVWVLDIDSRARVREVDLAAAVAGASCNDVALDASGVAYVTDRERAAIYRVTADGDATVWSDHALLRPRTIGLNGIAVTPDGEAVLVTHYKPARLLRVRMRDPSDVAEVELDGDAFDGRGHLVSGADGVRMIDGALYVAFDRWIMRLTSTDSWRTATVASLRAPGRRGVTAVVAARGSLYAANGQTARFLLGLRPALPFRLVLVDSAAFEAPGSAGLRSCTRPRRRCGRSSG